MESKNFDIENKQEINDLEIKKGENEDNNKDNNEFIEKIKPINQKDSEDLNTMSINKAKAIEKEINPFVFQLSLKMNFDNKKIYAIKELSKNRIGILFNNNILEIYNSITFLKINEIKVNVSPSKNAEENGYKNLAFDFIELKNYDLVFWTIETIYFYKLSEKEYLQYQEINESTQEEGNYHRIYGIHRYGYNNKDLYKINSICELKSGDLVTCNSYGIKIYNKENDNYKLLSKLKLDIEALNAIEIKLNKLVLMQKNFESGGFCSQTYYCILTYSLSIYDIENGKLTNLDTFKEDVSLRNNNISFFYNDKFLFVKYGGFKFGIYDINENMKSINKQNEIIETVEVREIYNFFRERVYKKLKDEMNIRFLCNYSKNLFFAADRNNDIKIYKFKDKSFEIYEEFPNFSKEIIGMIKLKNNNLIMYSYNYILIIKNN